ncbi:ribosome silencing factor [candidate division KSB1 bacterium]|nr:ribosome silencing factor [candidate division KSB1 bacterium]NIR72609.1 ribosome silencing factor [candidate division KSB1 bacterium]NIS23663.1 ribosome silencing factor [candidate division KSB1 bacterium]NIT70873.1 ribosome silencing factor [candidate division KSB1 bacterium]NIU24305.1 ribosome silencing factor [candidate division KSB1 bacterium]
MISKDLAKRIADLSLEKKAEDVRLLNLRPLTSMTDYFVLCTGATDTHVKAIADHIVDKLKSEKIRPLHIEGYARQEWVLVDYVDVVVHVFQPDKREFYSLERLWGDAEFEEIRDE